MDDLTETCYCHFDDNDTYMCPYCIIRSRMLQYWKWQEQVEDIFVIPYGVTLYQFMRKCFGKHIGV